MKALLNALESPDSELSILFVDNSGMAALSREHLGKDSPTNVLAFPMGEGVGIEINPELLGDVVVNVDYAALEAKEMGLTFETRLMELLIHGLLHLSGYDHGNDNEMMEMENMAEKLMAQAEKI